MINVLNNLIDQYMLCDSIYSVKFHRPDNNSPPGPYSAGFFCERLGTMAEGQVGNEARDAWLADQLVSNLGFEGAIQFCRVRAWDSVLKYVIALKETDEAMPTALDRSEALTGIKQAQGDI